MKKTIATILFAGIALAGCATQPSYLCDSGKLETTPVERFEINRMDGTAFDTKTKLTWKICAEGQSYTDGHCTSTATGFTWHDAMKTFGDKGDTWRLPNVDELNSIVEGRCRNPAINVDIFPDTPVSQFWSSSSYATNLAYAWAIGFDDGTSYSPIKSDSAYGTRYVRLVRGKQWLPPLKEAELKRAELAERQQRDAEQAAERQQRETEQTAAQAEKDAYVACNDKTSCDKTFSLTQIYINSTASQKIQVATDTIIETYNPTENGNVGMSAIKIPGKGSSAVIRLTVSCKVDEGRIYDKSCMEKKLNIYNGFRPFVNKMFSD